MCRVLRTDGVMMVTLANLTLVWSERHQVVSICLGAGEGVWKEDWHAALSS